MCHHVHGAVPELWKELESVDGAETEVENRPSFAREERDVEIELLVAADD